MAYIGQGIKNGTFKVLDTSGNTYNGSNATFDLGTQVGSPAQLLVSHDGVLQKPGTDYTLASNGTQITFTTEPASGASIFIIEISGAVGGPMNRDINGEELILDVDGDTSIHADTDDQIDIKIAGADDFQFTANTFTAQSGSTITTPTLGVGAAKDLGTGLHIKTADSGADVSVHADELVIEGSANSGLSILSGASSNGRIMFGDSGDNDIGYIEYDHSANQLALGANAASHLKIDSAGHVTKPNQPAASYRGDNEVNLTGDGTQKTIGVTSGAGVTELWDNNSDLSGGTFTAPVTGKYLITGQLFIEDIASNHTDMLLVMETSNRSYYIALDIGSGSLGRASADSFGFPFCAVADMDANDTHVLKLTVSNGSKVIDMVDLFTCQVTLLC